MPYFKCNLISPRGLMDLILRSIIISPIYMVKIFSKQQGFFPTNFKETNICRISKCENPKAMKDFRPISLCNVLCKLILKLLMNR